MSVRNVLITCMFVIQATCGLAEDSTPRTLALHYQTGLFIRAFDDAVRPDKEAFLLTGDLMLFRGPPAEQRWGFGVRLALDDDGHRGGPRISRRFALDRGGRFYAQASGVVYVIGDDNHMDLERPGYGLEVEVGYTSMLAVALGLDALPFKNLRLGVEDVGDAEFRELRDGAGTSLSGHVGVKAGQLPGVLGALAVVVLAAAS